MPPRAAWPWLGAATAAWALAAAVGAGPIAVVEPGPIDTSLVLTGDPVDGRFGPYVLAGAGSTTFLLDLESRGALLRGDTVRLTGEVSGGPGHAAGRRYSAVISVTTLTVVSHSPLPLPRWGAVIRGHILDRLEPFDDGRGLLAGFLIGDTSHVSASDVEAMRKSGLSHFTAVSGSNVALFLVFVYLVAGPLAMGPRRRALLGLAGLPVYAAVTGFEPSVMRASVMAAMALIGRLGGLVLDAWQLLSASVIALLVLDPGLVESVGFQLSVAATAGVLIGSRWPDPVRRIWSRPLLVTIGAQATVAPLLVFHFGSVPLVSPLVNLAAAPLVSASTVIGGVGALGIAPATTVAGWLAGIVLVLSRGAANWPQIGWPHLFALMLCSLLALWRPSIRSVLAVGAALTLSAVLLVPRGALPAASAVVFDVGQGDAILLNGGHGHFALVDGGPDQARILERLGRYDVTGLDLVVLTHVHADHASGLAAVVDRMAVAQIWAATEPHRTPASVAFEEALHRHGMSAVVPTPGDEYRLGDLVLTVIGPKRRYASPNDQSIVIMVAGPAADMLLTGDIEKVAQLDLGALPADVLKVPHQGAATSDAGWLRSVGATEAVISVGPNDFGHPAQWVIDELEDSGAVVHRTDLEGDVVVDLSEPPTGPNPAPP